MRRVQEQRGAAVVRASRPDGYPRTPRRIAAVLFLLLACVVSPSVLNAQTPEAQANQDLHREFRTDAFTHDDHALRLHVTADKSSLTLAQRLTVRLEAQMPVGWQVTWPIFGAELGEFNVVSVSEPVPGVIQGGDESAVNKAIGVSLRRTIVLEPNYAEKHEIPAMEFTFVPPNGVIGKTIKLTTEPIEIQVTSLLEDASVAAPDPSKGRGIAPIKPGFVASMRQFAEENRVWLIAAGSVLVVGLAGISFVAMRRRRTLAASPEMIARKRLGRVVVAKDAPPHVIAGAMVELADIVREYAAAQFNLPKADRTTEELLEDLAGVHGVPLAELKQMLMQFDQVKFAGATAHADDVRAAVVDVARFVEATCRIGMEEQDSTAQTAGNGSGPGVSPGRTEPEVERAGRPFHSSAQTKPVALDSTTPSIGEGKATASAISDPTDSGEDATTPGRATP